MPNTEQQREYHELESFIMRNVYPDAVYDEQFGEWAIPNGNGGFFLKKPGLEEVLLAIRLKRTDRAYAVDDTGLIFSAEIPSLSNRSEDAHWIFGKQLSDQSDECKKFLHSLLKE